MSKMIVEMDSELVHRVLTSIRLSHEDVEAVESAFRNAKPADAVWEVIGDDGIVCEEPAMDSEAEGIETFKNDSITRHEIQRRWGKWNVWLAEGVEFCRLTANPLERDIKDERRTD